MHDESSADPEVRLRHARRDREDPRPVIRGRQHLYFVGANDNPNPPGQGIDELGIVHQIGLAISEGDDLTRWRRWAGDGEAL